MPMQSSIIVQMLTGTSDPVAEAIRNALVD